MQPHLKWTNRVIGQRQHCIVLADIKCGTKLRVPVNADGLCVHMPELHPGSYHDKKSGVHLALKHSVAPSQSRRARNHPALAAFSRWGHQGMAHPEVIVPHRRSRSVRENKEPSSVQLKWNLTENHQVTEFQSSTSFQG